ncbi:hypothetical protein RJ639_014496 [Escallonia herrerae]|uniref:Cytochrome P450 n=1 Tax=Escallonia herrerae TaxID=1293975 RepID=A0AA88VHP8_9ASTE|nr:hypothetical protein RJ639_014496 [Escallonia herrerae]
MLILPREELIFFFMNHYDLILAVLVSIGVTIFLSKALRSGKGGIAGQLGLPFVGETFSFLSATNSTKGCYDFVRLRRLCDFLLYNKGYVKSMADAVGKNSLLCVPKESHKRIRRLLSDPFSMNSLAKFVQKLDDMLCERLQKLEMEGESFRLLDFNMKVAFDAMCNMLMSITDASMLKQIERDCTAVSDAMLSIPLMIPGTKYYHGIKRDSCPAEEKLNDMEIMDNLLTLIVAGQTTTAAAIMWRVKFLSENNQVQDRLTEEQLSILRNKSVGALLTLEDLNNMPYGSKVVKETLRMSNVLMWFPRVALDDCIIQGKFNLFVFNSNQTKQQHVLSSRDCPDDITRGFMVLLGKASF